LDKFKAILLQKRIKTRDIPSTAIFYEIFETSRLSSAITLDIHRLHCKGWENYEPKCILEELDRIING